MAYFDGDPDASGANQITTNSGLSGVKYAVAKSYGYINRYPNGRTGSGTQSAALHASRLQVRTAEQRHPAAHAAHPSGGGGRAAAWASTPPPHTTGV